jgi:hypothetical protein
MRLRGRSIYIYIYICMQWLGTVLCLYLLCTVVQAREGKGRGPRGQRALDPEGGRRWATADRQDTHSAYCRVLWNTGNYRRERGQGASALAVILLPWRRAFTARHMAGLGMQVNFSAPALDRRG